MEGKHTALRWTESQFSSLGGYLCNNSSKEVTVYSPHEKKNKKNSRGNEGEKDTGGNADLSLNCLKNLDRRPLTVVELSPEMSAKNMG